MSAEQPLTLNRREFLEKAGFVVAGLLAGSCVPKASPVEEIIAGDPQAIITAAADMQREKPAAIPTSTPNPTETPVPPATATATEAPTSTPAATSTPEAIKTADCGILSPEACRKGKYIEWKVSSGITVKGIGFILEPGEEIKIPKQLQVAGSQSRPPATYTGFKISAISSDSKMLYLNGDIKPAEEIETVGKNLPEGTIVGTIAGKNPVLNGAEFNLVVFFSTEEALKEAFPELTKQPPSSIDNVSLKAGPGSEKEFYDPKPPR